MLFCSSMTAGSVVGTLKDGGDTRIQPAVIEKIELFALTGGGDVKTSHLHPRAQTTW